MLTNSAPNLICDCFKYLECHGMNEIGVLRISGNQAIVDYLKQEFKKVEKYFRTRKRNSKFHHRSVLNNNAPSISVHDVASLVKAYIRAINPCLVPIEYADELRKIIDSDIDNETEIIKLSEVIKSIPSPNRECFGLIISFLRKVGSHHMQNQMNPENIATCMNIPLLGDGVRGEEVINLTKNKIIVIKLLTLPVRLYLPDEDLLDQHTIYEPEASLV